LAVNSFYKSILRRYFLCIAPVVVELVRLIGSPNGKSTPRQAICPQ
jgi:hypothetical protein